ncbi:MAG: cyanoexosortase A system-associated protein [Phormidium sp.]
MTIFSAVFGVLVKSILFAATSKTTIPLEFPAIVPLQEWQSLPSFPLVDSSGDRIPVFLSGRRYQYIKNNLTLDIEMRYFVDTSGEVKDFIKTYGSISVSPLIRQKEEIGFYGLFTHQERAYLSACINPHGSSTVTARQFKQNRNLYDLQFNRLLPWLLGQENLKDERCLWTNLSIPLNHSSPEVAYQSLENVWFSWYRWWNPQFPKP